MSEAEHQRLVEALDHIARQKPLAAYASVTGHCVGHRFYGEETVMFRRRSRHIDAEWYPRFVESGHLAPLRTETLTGELAARAALLIDRRP